MPQRSRQGTFTPPRSSLRPPNSSTLTISSTRPGKRNCATQSGRPLTSPTPSRKVAPQPPDQLQSRVISTVCCRERVSQEALQPHSLKQQPLSHRRHWHQPIHWPPSLPSLSPPRPCRPFLLPSILPPSTDQTWVPETSTLETQDGLPPLKASLTPRTFLIPTPFLLPTPAPTSTSTLASLLPTRVPLPGTPNNHLPSNLLHLQSSPRLPHTPPPLPRNQSTSRHLPSRTTVSV
mmetsp:Transcript_38421/g.63810  ORF Transcript_38421/g.63810 Transcript_38421/m.63810 type:complete len:234 (-) Transcript_38421:220-921(-)